MRNYLKLSSGVDVIPLLLEVNRQPELWDRNKARLSERGPHHQTHDIWLRYKDETENSEKGDYSNFGDPHDGVWYPAYYELPTSRKLIFDLMARVEGERLGGVLLYTVPPGKEIFRHTDVGWHVEYFEKFNICLQSNPKAMFFYNGDVMLADQGDIHWFRNDVPHWVKNDGDTDHIVLTVCIHVHDYKMRFHAVDSVGAKLARAA